MAEENPQNPMTTISPRTDPQIITTQNHNHDLPVAIPGIKLNGQNYEL